MAGCKLFQPEDPFDASVVARWWDGPKIAPGVMMTVQIGAAGHKPTSMTTMVDQNGDITLPHLLPYSLHCDGMTLEEFKQLLFKEYSVYYKSPQIVTTFAPFDGKGVSPWGTVTVLGEVGNPGPVNMPATMDLTVTKILQAAGGIRQYGDKSRVRVMRCIDKSGKQQKTIVDLTEIGAEGRVDKDIPLKAGDVVYVPPTWY